MIYFPKSIPENSSKQIGKCIYCGSKEDLTNEHIIPRSLAGNYQLLKASCQDCCKIIGNFERDVQREYFILVRTKLKLPTYHPKRRPTSFNFKATINGVEKVVSLSSSDCPTLFIMPHFGKPGYITNDSQSSILNILGTSLHGSGLKQSMANLNMQSISFTASLRTSFAKLLAKIAYGCVVYVYGLDAIKEAYVLPAILGKRDDIGRWVGCEDPQKSPTFFTKEDYLHRIEVFAKDNVVRVRIRLFASFRTPEYLVIVGHLKH